MLITWESRQGLQRQSNSDAAAVGISGEYLVAVVADAAERSNKNRLITGTNTAGLGLAQHWANNTVTEIISAGVYRNEAALIGLLKNQQEQLRTYYLHDRASYGLLIVNIATSELDWWFTGDCRLGLKTVGDQIDWLGTPHRLENVPLIGKKASPNTLTKCLKARRFSRPTHICDKVSAGQSIVIATDGYWCDHLRDDAPLVSVADDASVLSVESSPTKAVATFADLEIASKSDTDNLFVHPSITEKQRVAITSQS